jgi:hypothetical protein
MISLLENVYNHIFKILPKNGSTKKNNGALIKIRLEDKCNN